MLVGLRTPIFLAPAGMALLAALALALLALGGAPESRRADERVERFRAESAPLLAADVGQLQTRIHGQKGAFAPDRDALLAAWLRQYPRAQRASMRDWTRYHGLTASATSSRFVVRTSSGPSASGWFRLAVDLRSRTVRATCGGRPAPGCVVGRWKTGAHGHAPRYFLPR